MSISTENAIALRDVLGDPESANRPVLVDRMRIADPDLAEHAASVAELVVAMMGHLDGLTDADRQSIEDAAWLHDIGKLTIAPEVLRKAGPLDSSEWCEMRAHPERGAAFLAASSTLAPAAIHLLQHHEWQDGSGYPQALQGSNIEPGARMIGVADAYDAMTSWRPYRSTLTDAEAIDELQRCAGTQFDPEIVQIFILATKGQRRGRAE